MATESGGTEGTGGGVSHQLATLVPTFDPAVDDVTTWSTKVELLLAAWPESKIVELATRLILNTKGSAFQKLQLHRKELLVNESKGIKRIVELVGGTWGQVPLENRYELAEKALFRCQQKSDETGDSYIARVDVVWTELLSKSLTLDQLQAYVLLRGSRLSAEDKKRVLVESGAEGSSKTLEWSKVVAAIRMLSSNFFQDYTGSKREKTQKTYDHLAFATDDVDETENDEEAYWMDDECLDDDTISVLASEHDADANMILQFEEAITDAVQNDTELSAFFTSYQDARRRLTERVKFRGFWPVRKFGKGSGKKGSKAGHKGGKMTLAQKIANSNCRICGKKGHWKSECPQRAGGSQSSSSAASTNIPTSFVTTEDLPDAVMNLPMMPITDSQPDEIVFGVTHWEQDHNRWVKRGNGDNPRSLHVKFAQAIRTSLRNRLQVSPCQVLRDKSVSPDSRSCPSVPAASHDVFKSSAVPTDVHDVHFASSGTSGVVDLGASQTVIGSKQVVELLEGLPSNIRQRVRRDACQLVFRFGNHQTLTSKQALMIPLHDQWFRIAIVPGLTPFLLSSTFLIQIRAVMDTEAGTLWSKLLNKQLILERTSKNLFLMDVNQLWEPAATACAATPLSSEEAQNEVCQKDVEQPFTNDTHAQQSQYMLVQNHSHTCHDHEPNAKESSVMFLKSDQGHGETRSDEVVEGVIESVSRHSSYRHGTPVSDCTEPSVSSHRKSHDREPICVSDVQPGCAVQRVPQGVQAGEQDRQSRGPSEHDVGRTGIGENHVWGDQKGCELQGCLPGCGLDRVYPVPLRKERQDRACDVREVCGLAHAAGERSPSHVNQNSHQDASQGEQEHATGARRCVDRAAGWRYQSNAAECNGGQSDRDPRGHGLSPPGESKPGTSSGPNGDDAAGDHGAPAQDHREIGELRVLTESEAQILKDRAFFEQHLFNAQADMDHDFQPESTARSFSQTCHRYIKQFQTELHMVSQKFRNRRYSITLPKLDVLEVMCSSESELVKQANLLGGRACRFGLSEGDLSTSTGRSKLFEILVLQCPEHLWYSPECGPWGKWSNLNMGKSLQGMLDGLEKRKASLWQIALAVVLFRYQSEHQRHFHMEQPDGSHMLVQPCLKEVLAGSLECCFDLCQLGGLTDPETHLPIRKRLRVLTTSQTLHRTIHGKWCSKDHVHRHIEGSIVHQGHRMSMSSFTELYPRKFARQIVKVLLHGQNKEQPVYAIRTEPPEGASDDHPTKRRRLRSKLSPGDIAQRFARVNWQTVMTMANDVAPRVGTLVIEHGELLDKVQQLCPDHKVAHLVLCRGTDRYVGPTKVMPKGLAPLRKRICIRRRHEDIDVDDSWEPWERLTYKGLRRKGVPARVSLTVFASVKIPDPAVTGNQPAVPSADASPERIIPDFDLPEAKRARTEPAAAAPDQPPSNSQHEISQEDEVDRETVDLASQKHGPRFLALKPEMQAWLLKVHRNLGHPGAQKLATFCKQLGCPNEMVQAIGDLRCSTCLENGRPTISRPSAIHENCDFGDVVSMDGVVWTNRSGTQFYIYHFIDQSTSYHTAVVATSHSAEQAIQAFARGWVQWAGPPNLLCMDAGSELNAEEFLSFLQKHGIKHRTIATDAHWQNSRIERHGAILQDILSKMDTEEAITDHASLEMAVSMATHTKNQWSRHRGYPPEVLVFGKSTKISGSVSSDESSASHLTAESLQPDGIRFRSELAMRERARKAFAETDNSQVIRRALLQRSRPFRGQYMQGDHVMMWRKRGEANGNWIGPLRVIIQEGANIVWVTMGQKLFRVAPEHLRPLSAVEEWTQSPQRPFTETQSSSAPISHEPFNINTIIPPQGGTQYHNLTNVPSTHVPEIPTPETSSGSDAIPNQDNSHSPPQITPSNQSVISVNSDQPDQEPNPNIPATLPAEMIPDPNVPVEVPVPADDELFVQDEMLFHVTTDQCWKLEVDISHHDIHKWREEESPHEMAFLVSAAKRQRSEVKLTQLSPEDRERFAQAKFKEIDSWITTETIARITRNKIPRENVMRCRWILTWKDAGETASSGVAKKYTPKARLVVLGFEDPDVDSIPRDSPTMNRLSRNMILQLASSNSWDIQSFDIKTAFLRGSEHDNRMLGLEPPEEMRQRLKLHQNEIVQLLKGAYGRVDAPYLWFKELQNTLCELGFKQSPFDPCLFTLVDAVSHKTVGVIGVHVDDGLCCGSAEFQSKLAMLEAKYPFGAKKKHEFTFTGLKIKQNADYSVEVNQTQYVKDITAISLSRERRLTPDDPVTEPERQALRAVVGSLQYAAVNTRPDLCARLGWLQSRINHAQVSTLIEANRTLHEAKQHADTAIHIHPIPIEELRYVAFSDASFASEKNPNSHQGMIIMAAHKDIGENARSVINPVIWHSKKIQKVAVSTLSAEAMALAGAVDILSWVRLMWAWVIDHRCNWRQADETLLRLPPAFSALNPEEEPHVPVPETVDALVKSLPENQQAIITTDCKSLFDLINRTAPPACTEFRTLLQAKLIKEHLQHGVKIRWVPSGAQIADALTKVMDNTMLRTCLQKGFYSLHDEQEILKARSDSRTRIKWLQAQAQGSQNQSSASLMEKPSRP